jgi:hypothetical protein
MVRQSVNFLMWLSHQHSQQFSVPTLPPTPHYWSQVESGRLSPECCADEPNTGKEGMPWGRCTLTLRSSWESCWVNKHSQLSRGNLGSIVWTTHYLGMPWAGHFPSLGLFLSLGTPLSKWLDCWPPSKVPSDTVVNRWQNLLEAFIAQRSASHQQQRMLAWEAVCP